jgi:hypothetical protein
MLAFRYEKILTQLKKNWIKYGFETVAIFVDILCAVTLDNRNNLRLKRKDEIEYLSNLKFDLESQLIFIEVQKDFEEYMGSACEGILDILQKPPHDIAKLNELVVSLGRMPFIVRNPIYEDLKSSSNPDIISDGNFRNTLLKFSQHIDNAETILSRNNETIHRLSNFFIENARTDLG